MKCKCGFEHMSPIFVWDDDQQTDIAYNLYGCDYCGMICKITVTDHPESYLWIPSSVSKITEYYKMDDAKATI